MQLTHKKEFYHCRSLYFIVIN